MTSSISSLRIIFAGTPTFAADILAVLLKNNIAIELVLSQPDQDVGRGLHSMQSPVKQLAEAQSIPVLTPSKIRDPSVFETLAKIAPDLMIVVAYGKLLPKTILALPRYGCLNIHASLLPQWRGASPIQQAILRGDKETGITLMQMTSGLDEGPIVAQAAIPLNATETAASLHAKLTCLAGDLLLRSLPRLENLLQTATPQDEREVSYAPKIVKQDGEIDWHMSAIEIERKIRAFTPWPSTYTHLNKMLIKIHQAKVIHENSTVQPGAIIKIDSEGLLVQTGSSCLLIQTIQLPGKKPMPVQAVLNGHPNLFAIGLVFYKLRKP